MGKMGELAAMEAAGGTYQTALYRVQELKAAWKTHIAPIIGNLEDNEALAEDWTAQQALITFYRAETDIPLLEIYFRAKAKDEDKKLSYYGVE